MERTIRTKASVFLLLLTAIPAHAALIFYSTEGGRDFSHLYSYETATGAISDQGLLRGRRYTTDLAVDPAGALYGVGWSNARATGAFRLFEIEPGDDGSGSWRPQTVQADHVPPTVAGAVFDGEGNLYVCSSSGILQKLTYDGDQDLWVVAKTGHMGAEAGGDLAFSADARALYVALAGGVLATLDFQAASSTFGQAAVIGPTGYEEVAGLAMVDGVLYGTTNTSGGYGQSYLIQIDPLTAESSVVADLGA
ncbi:unnamed protein product, partial [marine sediment metagenome]